jgi:hypothetical protein
MSIKSKIHASWRIQLKFLRFDANSKAQEGEEKKLHRR